MNGLLLAGAAVAQLIAGMSSVPGRTFLIGRTEVTQAAWQEVTGTNPSRHVGADLPVECVSWNDCRDFLAKLNARPEVRASGLVFRLPEHEEWTCAARADGREPCADAGSWHAGNAGGETHPVARKEPNGFGLFDMRGNVAEWTATPDGATRDVVGGAYCHFPGQFPDAVENVHPHRYFPDRCFDFLGLRLAADCPALVKSPRVVYSVRAFGAKGDGVAKDTAAIQRAIDAAHAAGGGTVELGEGTYLSGSIFLKSNVDFFIGQHARLLASPDPADFNARDVCAQNSYSKHENASGAHLILCIEQENVTVRGPGRINGNSKAFLIGPNGERYRENNIPFRPAQMLYFVESKNVRVQDLELKNASYWSCFFFGCEQVMARGLWIHNARRDYYTPNGDGIDIDCSEHVTVSDCRIDTADDSITLRASGVSRLKQKRDCAYVTIANCNLSSACNAIRIGVGSGSIHDAVFSNLTMDGETRTAVNFVSSWVAETRGVDIARISFANVISHAAQFCRAYAGHSNTANVLADVTFSNVTGSQMTPSEIAGHPDRPAERFRFLNVNLPQGVTLDNVRDPVICGGTFKAVDLSPEQRRERARLLDCRRRELWGAPYK